MHETKMPDAAAQYHNHRQSHWHDLATSLRDPNIERIIEGANYALAQDAWTVGIDIKSLTTQARLHLPRLGSPRLQTESPMSAYNAVRVQTIARCSAIKTSTDQAEYMAHSSLLTDAQSLRRDLTVEFENDSSIVLKFSSVAPIIGNFVQSRLHYLLSPRCDTVIELGVSIPGAQMPVAYLAFSLCDRKYLQLTTSKIDNRADKSNVLVMTRMFGLPGIPANLMSIMISKAIRTLRASTNVRYIVTAFNPMLGFTGTAFQAAGFVPFATAPVTYSYNDRGFYTIRRRSGADLLKNLNAPNNVLVILGTSREANRIISQLDSHFDITRQTHSYKDIYDLYSEDTSIDKAGWRSQLPIYRQLLQSAWSADTAHPSYITADPVDVGPRGQCGVASVWLARELRTHHGIEATYCYGRLEVALPGVESVNHHCWLEIGPSSSQTRLIVDLTCDQATGLDRMTLCERHEDLIQLGLHYVASFRLTLDELPEDRVWPRFLILSNAINQIQHPLSAMLDARV